MELKILKAEYKLLSRLEDEFVRGSKHKAYKFIQSKMDETLEKIIKIEATKRTPTVIHKFVQGADNECKCGRCSSSMEFCG